MARYPGAEWRGPIPRSNYAPGRKVPVRGVVIHHMDGFLRGTDFIFNKEATGRSAHFGTGRNGTVYQWVDTDDVSYHACNANWSGYIGIENEDNGDDLPLSDAQITAIRGIIDWLGIDKKLMTSMNDTGVGYHSQFPGPCATHWGQTVCPSAMIPQLPLLVSAPIPVPPPYVLPKGKKMSVMLCDGMLPVVIDSVNSLAYECSSSGSMPAFTVTPDQRTNILNHYAH